MNPPRLAYRATGEFPRPNSNGRQNIVGLGATSTPTATRIMPFRSPGWGEDPIECPAFGCGPYYPGRIGIPGGPVPVGPSWWQKWFENTVPQPPPGQLPGSVVANPLAVPTSPAPSPTVQVPASQTALNLPNPGTTLNADGSSPTVAPSGFGAWLSENTLISALPNWVVAGGGAVLLYMLMGKRR